MMDTHREDIELLCLLGLITKSSKVLPLTWSLLSYASSHNHISTMEPNSRVTGGSLLGTKAPINQPSVQLVNGYVWNTNWFYRFH